MYRIDRQNQDTKKRGKNYPKSTKLRLKMNDNHAKSN